MIFPKKDNDKSLKKCLPLQITSIGSPFMGRLFFFYILPLCFLEKIIHIYLYVGTIKVMGNQQEAHCVGTYYIGRKISNTYFS